MATGSLRSDQGRAVSPAPDSLTQRIRTEKAPRRRFGGLVHDFATEAGKGIAGTL
jgi:hypothetical protein